MHAISMRPPLSTPLTPPHHSPPDQLRPSPRPARLICMHIPRRHIPGLSLPPCPARAWAPAGAGRQRRGGEGAAGQVGGRRTEECGGSLLPPTPEVSYGRTLGVYLFFKSFGLGKLTKKRPAALSFHLFRLPGKSARLARRGRGWGGSLCAKVPANSEGTKGPSRGAPHPLSVPRAGPVARGGQSAKLAGAGKRVRGPCEGARLFGAPRPCGLAADSEGESRGPRAPRPALAPEGPCREDSGQTRRSR